jgi:type IV pilus assembly protein PilQ
VRLLRALALCVSLCGHCAATTAEPNEVQNVDSVTLHTGATQIRVVLKHPLAQPPLAFRTFHPAARVVLDLPQATVAPGRRIVQPERGLVRSIHLLRHATGTRLIVELVGQATYETALEGNILLVTLRRTPPARDQVQRFGAASSLEHRRPF